jgi:hypothetical protein
MPGKSQKSSKLTKNVKFGEIAKKCQKPQKPTPGQVREKVSVPGRAFFPLWDPPSLSIRWIGEETYHLFFDHFFRVFSIFLNPFSKIIVPAKKDIKKDIKIVIFLTIFGGFSEAEFA